MKFSTNGTAFEEIRVTGKATMPVWTSPETGTAPHFYWEGEELVFISKEAERAGWYRWFGAHSPNDELIAVIDGLIEARLYAPLTWNNPLLRQRAAPVTEITEETLWVADQMKRTMEALGGIGIAAPQIGILKRIIHVNVDGVEATIINPQVTTSQGVTHGPEGCLSFPGLEKRVRRRKSVKVEGFGVHAEPVVIEATGLLARCLQHEIDHLNGVVLPDKGF